MSGPMLTIVDLLRDAADALEDAYRVVKMFRRRH